MAVCKALHWKHCFCWLTISQVFATTSPETPHMCSYLLSVFSFNHVHFLPIKYAASLLGKTLTTKQAWCPGYQIHFVIQLNSRGKDQSRTWYLTVASDDREGEKGEGNMGLTGNLSNFQCCRFPGMEFKLLYVESHEPTCAYCAKRKP